MLQDMDKPIPEVGQTWVICDELWRIKEIRDALEYHCPVLLVDNKGREGSWELDMRGAKFVSGPVIATASAPTGNRAADWLRNVAKVLEEKAISYGDSVGNPIRVFSHAGKTEGIKVRIDDKLSRVARGKEWPGDDVIVDLVGYLALLAVTEEK